MAVDATPPPPPAELPTPPPGPPAAPTGLYPSGDLQIWTEWVRMLCDTVPGATDYAFQVEHFNGSQFSAYYTYETNENAREFSPVYDNRVYRWRVRAHNGDGWGSWSDWAQLEFGSATQWPNEAPPEEPPPEEPPPEEDPPQDPPPQDPPPPGAPTGLSPVHGTTVSGASVSMACDPISGAEEYAFEIEHYNGSSFVGYYTYETGATSQTFWPAYNDRAFRFRVRARTGTTWGPNSSWNIFLFGNASMP